MQNDFELDSWASKMRGAEEALATLDPWSVKFDIFLVTF